MRASSLRKASSGEESSSLEGTESKEGMTEAGSLESPTVRPCESEIERGTKTSAEGDNNWRGEDSTTFDLIEGK